MSAASNAISFDGLTVLGLAYAAPLARRWAR
jgi:hypothetical protein